MMKKHSLIYVVFLLLFLIPIVVHAQLRVKITFGQIAIDDGIVNPNVNKYLSQTDSLDKRLVINPNDTSSLFLRALLYLHANSAIAKPYQETKGALENLKYAKDMAEKAIGLKMQNFNLKVLRAQIYKELTYRFTGDESWQYNRKQVAERKNQFNEYKGLANKYYDELAELDKHDAYYFQRLKVTGNYPL